MKNKEKVKKGLKWKIKTRVKQKTDIKWKMTKKIKIWLKNKNANGKRKKWK